MNNRDIRVSASIILISVLGTLGVILFLQNPRIFKPKPENVKAVIDGGNKDKKEESSKNNDNVEFSTIHDGIMIGNTGAYCQGLSSDKNYVDSISGLKKFNSHCDRNTVIDDKYFKDYSVFFLQEAGSGMDKFEFKNVSFNNNKLEFEISDNHDQICPDEDNCVVTDDFVTWLFIAVIPNDKIKNIDISDWTKIS